MRRLTIHGYCHRASSSRRPIVLAGAALLAACGGGGDGDVSSSPEDTESRGLEGMPSSMSNDTAPTCDGDDVAALPAGFALFRNSGDLSIIHEERVELEEQSLITGETTPLFELEQRANGVVSDARDVFAIGNLELHKYTRASGELSVFAEPPRAGEDAMILGNTAFSAGLALSDANVFAVIHDFDDIDFAAGVYERAFVGIYDRLTGERRLAPVPAPVPLTVELDAWRGRFFDVRAIDTDPTPARSYAGEVYTYDVATGVAELLLESSSPIESYNYAFWGDYFVATVRTEDGRAWRLVRVPIAGGTPEVVLDGVSEPAMAILADKAYVTLSVRVEGGANRKQLTEVDLVSGGAQPVGACEGIAIHASERYLYVNDSASGQTKRLEL